MKDLKEYFINESVFKNNLHDNMSSIEQLLTQKISELVGNNNTLKVEVDGTNIEFLKNNEVDNENDSEIYSAAGILVERYLTSLLDNEIQSESFFGNDFNTMLDELQDLDNGSYENYDFEIGDLCFEVKSYHKTENNGIWMSKAQTSKIGNDAFFIFAQVAVSKNNLLIKDIVVRQKKNLKTSGNYIKGAK